MDYDPSIYDIYGEPCTYEHMNDDPFEILTASHILGAQLPPPPQSEDTILKAALSSKASSLHQTCLTMQVDQDHWETFKHWWNYYGIPGAFVSIPLPPKLQHYHLAPLMACNGDFRKLLIGNAELADEWYRMLDSAYRTLMLSNRPDDRMARFRAVIRV